MRSIRLCLAIALLVGLIIAIFPQAPARILAENDLPRFEPAPCAFDTWGISYQLDCGYLLVPEDRSTADSPTIRLHVATIHSTAATPRLDPLLVLEGGPGLSVLDEAWFLADIFAPVLDTRDIILMDQRGTGYSEPNLACPEYTDQVLADLSEGGKFSKALVGSMEGMLACQQRLLDSGIKVGAYNTVENAADVAALRQVLGYKIWNIYGVSYGTRLALMVMRNHPQGIRTVTLDSAYPPMADFYSERTQNTRTALNHLFAACAADSGCSQWYPDLEAKFFEVIERLDAAPVIIESYDFDSDKTVQMALTGEVVAWLIGSLLRNADSVSIIPQFIYRLADEDYDDLSYIVRAVRRTLENISYGMYFSVQCSEAIPYSTFDPAASFATIASVNIPQHVDNMFIFSVCGRWQAEALNANYMEPMTSEIPTLVLAGEIDPTTPPRWGRMTADMLTNSYYYEFPDTGHGVIAVDDSCPVSIIEAFIDTPRSEPNTRCIQQMPALRFE